MNESRGYWSSVAVVAALVVALAAAAFVVLRPSSPPASGYVSHYDQIVREAREAEPVNVVAFGDSYTAGTGATASGRSWVQLVADREGWVLTNLALGGTGYLQTSGKEGCGEPTCPNYTQALRRADEYAPDVVLVAGGRNDLAQSPERVHAAVDAFFSELAQQFPDADLVAVRPWWDSTTPPAQLAVEAHWIRAAVTRVGGTYLDTGQPLGGHPALISEDGVHPNDSGHAALARAVEAALAS